MRKECLGVLLIIKRGETKATSQLEFGDLPHPFSLLVTVAHPLHLYPALLFVAF
jgi:hypothetical protein